MDTVTRQRRNGSPLWPFGLAVLAALEAAWLAWFLVEPLPNAPPDYGLVRRGMFLVQLVPELIPGVRFEESQLGMALSELSHVENLPQRLPIVLAAGWIAGAAVGLGRLALRGLGVLDRFDRWELPALAFALGATGLGVITLAIGRLGLLGPWPIRIGLTGLILAEGLCWIRQRRRSSHLPAPGAIEPDRRQPAGSATPSGAVSARVAPLGLALVTGPFLVLMALGAMLPAIDYDALSYHLQAPKEYFQQGSISFLPHNVYAGMPLSVEMLHLLGMEVLGDWWTGALAGQLLVALFAPATAILIARTARRYVSPRAAWCAAVIYLTTPWVYRLAVIPYVEGALCSYHAALLALALRAGTSVPPAQGRLWGVAGFLAGGAMACKYPALLSAVLPFGLLAVVQAVRRRSWRIVLAYLAGWAVVMAPWLGKNVIDTGNPVYPLGYRVFGGRHWDADLDAKWWRAHGPRPIEAGALVSALVDVAGRSDWQSPLYAALAPLALLRPGSRRLAGVLWGYVAYLFLTWWLLTHRLDRFWIPLLPPLAILAGIGADAIRRRAWSILLAAVLVVSILSNLTYIATVLCGFNDWTGDYRVLRTRVPATINPSLAALNTVLPPGSKVLLVGQAAVFHFDHPLVYNSVFNYEIIETLARDRSPDEVRQTLRRRGITHVYVDWPEIARYRSPGHYGFTPFVTPELFSGLVSAGVLSPPVPIGEAQRLYRVR
jgi:4-amino-4-deoxy-L-arabinose transferase-like glycosyltransferase